MKINIGPAKVSSSLPIVNGKVQPRAYAQPVPKVSRYAMPNAKKVAAGIANSEPKMQKLVKAKVPRYKTGNQQMP